jgi:hypothetical protein
LRDFEELTPRSHVRNPHQCLLPWFMVACERRRIYCSARSSTRNTEWRGDTVQVCAPPLRSSSLRERIWPSLGDRISRRTASTARSLLRRPARRTTRVCAAHRRSRGPGDFLIGKGEALRSLPGVRLPAPAPERLSAAHSQFTIHNSHGKSIVRARAAHAHRLEVPARGQWAAPIGQRQELPKGISRHAIARRRAEGADHVAAAAAVVGRADAGGI